MRDKLGSEGPWPTLGRRCPPGWAFPPRFDAQRKRDQVQVQVNSGESSEQQRRLLQLFSAKVPQPSRDTITTSET